MTANIYRSRLAQKGRPRTAQKLCVFYFRFRAMEEREFRKVSWEERSWGLSPSRIELLNRVETAGGLGLNGASCPIEEVRRLIVAGLLSLEVTLSPWGTDFRVVPAMVSDSKTNKWEEVSERDAAN
jgi:hypothetical protein